MLNTIKYYLPLKCKKSTTMSYCDYRKRESLPCLSNDLCGHLILIIAIKVKIDVKEGKKIYISSLHIK